MNQKTSLSPQSDRCIDEQIKLKKVHLDDGLSDLKTLNSRVRLAGWIGVVNTTKLASNRTNPTWAKSRGRLGRGSTTLLQTTAQQYLTITYHTITCNTIKKINK